MSKPRVDKTKCRHCGLSEPHIKMLKVNGNPRGECKQCFALVEQNRGIRKNAYSGFYSTVHNLTSANYKLLSTLPPQAYPLLDRQFREQAGFIVLQRGRYYVKLWEVTRAVERDLYGMSAWLSNQNLIIDPAPLPLVDSVGAVIDVQALGKALVPIVIQDLLVMYDSKLRDYAVKKLRAEIAEEKRRVAKIKR